MLIKYPGLSAQLKKQLQPLYVLVGNDYYLLQQAADSIKQTWAHRDETEIRRIDVTNTADWNHLIKEANTYTLFAEQTLLDIRFEKKTIDSAAKGILSEYLQNPNRRCLLLLHAYQVPAKQLSWLSNHPQAALVQATPLPAHALQQWIKNQLQQLSLTYTPEVPALISHYTQGNMLAAAQAIEKLGLLDDTHMTLTADIVQHQLIDQAEFQLYELTDACLAAQSDKALRVLRHAYHNRIEPTLIIWLLTQEIRLLIELTYLRKQSIPFSTACTQLKIWPQRVKLFEAALKRLPLPKLYELLQKSYAIDECIKTQQNQSVWQALEQFAIGFRGVSYL